MKNRWIRNDTLTEVLGNLRFASLGVFGDSLLDDATADENRARDWSASINKLFSWYAGMGDLEDEAVRPPTVNSIIQATRRAQSLMNYGWPAPLRIVPDGEGGLSFEWREGPVFTTLEIWADGLCEWTSFRDGRVVSRRSLANPLVVEGQALVY